uniref:K Homology domain-containing protein n=1 Tax=Trichobilharzia regenti TaxID=157069 RepID=A0AA85JNZ0_TRIRE|nr:unnamed protein product [Trichobilharzia regenti]
MSELYFKILIPNTAAGAVIGKGGEAVETIKRQTGARLKMSRANDFYPGTTERVCLIIGTLESCMKLHDYVMSKIYERPQNITIITPTGISCMERHKQVKILVPDSTAGIIIGKHGYFIEKIKKESCAFIQVSQRPKDIRLFERCVVITGELEERRKAVEMIMHKMLEDPDLPYYSNCSYSQITEPIASAFSIGSPFAMAYQPSVNPNGLDLNFVNTPDISVPNFPDNSLPNLTSESGEYASIPNQFGQFHHNQSIPLPYANTASSGTVNHLTSTGQPLTLNNANHIVNLPQCNTGSHPFIIQPNLTIDQSKSLHSNVTLDQMMYLGHPTIHCQDFLLRTCGAQNCILQCPMKLNEQITLAPPPLAFTNQPTAETKVDNESNLFVSNSQLGDRSLTVVGSEKEHTVPFIISGDTIPSHSRYLSGESVDSALTESLLSVKLQSSTEDFMTDLFQPQQQIHHQISQVHTVLSPESVYSLASSTQKSKGSLCSSNQSLVIDSQKSDSQTLFVPNDSYNRFLPGQNKSPEFTCLPSGYYAPGVGGILLVGTVPQLHNALHLLEWQAKQQPVNNLIPGTGITSTHQTNGTFNSYIPASSLGQTIAAPLSSVCRNDTGNLVYTTSFSSNVALKLDTIQPLSMPKHLTQLSLHVPVNQH